MMNRLSVAAIFAVSAIGFTQIASAADLPRKAPAYAPPPAPIFSWTGCFIGGNVGGLWAHKEWIDATPGNAEGFLGQSHGSHDADGVLGGVQGGCDYQFAGGWLLGIQGDYDWTDAKGSSVDLGTPDTTINTRLKSLASVTGRVGYAWDRVLGYVKGGGAWERAHYFILAPTGETISDADATRSGWTIGVGGEYAFYNWLSVFAEYDYYDFGSHTSLLLDTTTHLVDTGADIKEHNHVFKVGLNLRWGPWR